MHTYIKSLFHILSHYCPQFNDSSYNNIFVCQGNLQNSYYTVEERPHLGARRVIEDQAPGAARRRAAPRGSQVDCPGSYPWIGKHLEIIMNDATLFSLP